MPLEEKAAGKRGKSLTLTVGASEATERDGETDTLAVGLKTASEEPVLHLTEKSGVEAQKKKIGVRIQGIEDSSPEPLEKEKNGPADEIEAAGVVLLSVSGFLNGFPVTFLIDSGASECFVDTAFTETNGIKTVKRKEKLQIYLADGTVRVSQNIVQQGCVSIGEHAEFLDFSVLKLPKYDAILGKAWLDRWNPAIDWKKNTMQWKVGTRLVTVTGEQALPESEVASSIFQINCTVNQISAQRMRKLAKTEAVFLAVVRTTNEDTRNEATVTVNEDQTKTSYPVEVQAILNDFSDVFPKDLPGGLPPSREVGSSY